MCSCVSKVHRSRVMNVEQYTPDFLLNGYAHAMHFHAMCPIVCTTLELLSLVLHFITGLALFYYVHGTVQVHFNVPWHYTSDSIHPCIPVPRGIQISSLRSLNKCLYHANPPYSGRRRPTHEWCKNFLFRPTSAGPWVMGDSHHQFTHQIWKSPRNIGCKLCLPSP